MGAMARKRDSALPASLACLVLFLAVPSPAEDDRIYWLTSYKEAIREAKRTQKPIFLEFRCEP